MRTTQYKNMGQIYDEGYLSNKQTYLFSVIPHNIAPMTVIQKNNYSSAHMTQHSTNLFRVKTTDALNLFKFTFTMGFSMDT